MTSMQAGLTVLLYKIHNNSYFIGRILEGSGMHCIMHACTFANHIHCLYGSFSKTYSTQNMQHDVVSSPICV